LRGKQRHLPLSHPLCLSIHCLQLSQKDGDFGSDFLSGPEVVEKVIQKLSFFFVASVLCLRAPKAEIFSSIEIGKYRWGTIGKNYFRVICAPTLTKKPAFEKSSFILLKPLNAACCCLRRFSQGQMERQRQGEGRIFSE
jgi:hypothetical protein